MVQDALKAMKLEGLRRWQGEGWVKLLCFARARREMATPGSAPGAMYVKSQVSGMHGLFVRGGAVFSFGNSEHGQLGLGNNHGRDLPQFVNLAERVVAVSAGAYHSLALTASGSVFSWGRGSRGRLGLGNEATLGRPNSARSGSWH